MRRNAHRTFRPLHSQNYLHSSNNIKLYTSTFTPKNSSFYLKVLSDWTSFIAAGELLYVKRVLLPDLMFYLSFSFTVFSFFGR